MGAGAQKRYDSRFFSLHVNFLNWLEFHSRHVDDIPLFFSLVAWHRLGSLAISSSAELQGCVRVMPTSTVPPQSFVLSTAAPLSTRRWGCPFTHVIQWGVMPSLSAMSTSAPSTTHTWHRENRPVTADVPRTVGFSQTVRACVFHTNLPPQHNPDRLWGNCEGLLRVSNCLVAASHLTLHRDHWLQWRRVTPFRRSAKPSRVCRLGRTAKTLR